MYLGPCQTSMMEWSLFAKIVTGFYLLTISEKNNNCITYIWQVSKYAPVL